MFTCTPLCKRHLVILPQQRISIAASSISHKSQPKPGKSSNTQREVVGKHAIAMSAAGAVLGPLCDGQHSQHVVLVYNNSVLISVDSLGWQLQTCWYSRICSEGYHTPPPPANMSAQQCCIWFAVRQAIQVGACAVRASSCHTGAESPLLR